MLETGQIINNIYQVQEPIGEGGAGQVYLAWHNNLQKNVVIKRIKDDYVGKVKERREADILKNLRHRYLPQVYDFIQMENEVYTVIDYIDGNSLLEYIQAGIRFDEAQTIKWLKQLLEALDYLHSQNPPIIHSDIKPSNIMVDTNGDICLIDFNISFDENDRKKISGYSEGYASPEQIRKVQMYSTGGNYLGIHIDARSDIFSLGASFYHMMTKQNPIERMKANKDLWDFPLPYSEALVEILKKSLYRNPEKRYQTAAHMLNDLNTMKLRDSRYRKLRRIQMVYSSVFILLFSIGMVMIVRGLSLRNEENFENEYRVILDSKDEVNSTTLISNAMELLNNRKYVSLAQSHAKERSDLLYLIANSYFENEDYQNAVLFYEQAIETNSENPEYYRDYAIAEARTGRTDGAWRVLEEGEEKGLKDADLYLVQAEIANSNDEIEMSIDLFNKVLSSEATDDTLGRAYVLCARAYRKSGELEKASDLLQMAYQNVNDTWRLRVLREQGSLCIQYLEENGTDYSEDWLERAEKSFDTLSNSSRGTFNDRMNLVLIKEMKGDLSSAEDILINMRSEYPDDYRVPMIQALIVIEEQIGTDESVRDFSIAKMYYEEANSLYSKVRNAGNSDDKMQHLEELINELYEKGWLIDDK